MIASVLAAEGSNRNFVELDVELWHWGVLLVLIVVLLMIDLLVVHKEAHEVKTKEAAIESAVWISCGLAFSLVVWWWFGGAATGEYMSGYLIEKSLSIDNVFVWALIMGYFRVPQKYQHRVLFWGIFGALVMRAIFIFAGIAIIERFDWVLYVFGAFLLYTAGKLVFSDNDHVDPGESKFLKVVNRFVRTTHELDGQKLFTRLNGHRVATPLFSVLLLVMRAIFIFAGIAIIERFDWVLYVFGAFLLYTAGKLVFSDNDHVDPGESKFLKVVNRFVRTTHELDGQKLFTRLNGHRVATPLFSVLLLVEATDVLFAVDSVPAVLAVSHEQFLVFSSNAFAILGLRALYFLLADMHSRFAFLQQGLAIILAFVGVKMLIHTWYHIPTWLSLTVIIIVLAASIGFSLKYEERNRDAAMVGDAFESHEDSEARQSPDSG